MLWHYLHQYVMHDRVRFYSSAEIAQDLTAADFGGVAVIARLQKVLWHRKFDASRALVRGINKGPGLVLASRPDKP